MKIANIVVYSFEAGCWRPMKPADTPQWLKEPGPMREMIRGDILEHEGQFYRAKKLSDSKLVLSQGKAVMHKRPQVIQ